MLAADIFSAPMAQLADHRLAAQAMLDCVGPGYKFSRAALSLRDEIEEIDAELSDLEAAQALLLRRQARRSAG